MFCLYEGGPEQGTPKKVPLMNVQADRGAGRDIHLQEEILLVQQKKHNKRTTHNITTITILKVKEIHTHEQQLKSTKQQSTILIMLGKKKRY